MNVSRSGPAGGKISCSDGICEMNGGARVRSRPEASFYFNDFIRENFFK